MIIDQLHTIAPDRPLVDMAWSVLDVANDLRDTGTVEACRRVIDASLRGGVPAQSDMNFVFIFSNS
jgi:hypothetical protein